MRKIMFVRHVVARSLNQCGRGNATVRSIFIVVGVDVPVNNMKMFFVALERQHCVPFAGFKSYKILRTAVDNNEF
jgi:hypothetical protein